MENVERWISHSAMSDTGRHAAAVAELLHGISALNSVVQGLLIHSDWLGTYGVCESDFDRISRDTLPVAERLGLVLARGSGAITERRPPAQREVGTCRDFALMLCGFLRSQGISARLRCGFADYFVDGWEDHWVCEYWNPQSASWHLSDAQLDDLLKEKCRIAFDPADAPRQHFMTAGQAWMACRVGELDPGRFGHGQVKGLWFVGVNVVRDHYVVNNRETSAWDAWRAASEEKRIVAERDLAWLDQLAVCPEQTLVEVSPDWTT
jgi:hypothetical protein